MSQAVQSDTDRERETLRRYFAAVDAGDVETLLGCFAADAVYERPGYDPLRGMDELRAFYRNVRVIAVGDHVVEGMIIDGRAGAAWGSFTGTSRAGEPLAEKWADIYRFNDAGLINFRRSHFFLPAI